MPMPPMPDQPTTATAYPAANSYPTAQPAAAATGYPMPMPPMAMPAQPLQPIVINNHIQPPVQEVHLVSTGMGGGMGGIVGGGGMHFARQYPALLHPYISQQDLFAELDKAEAILADAMRGSINP